MTGLIVGSWNLESDIWDGAWSRELELRVRHLGRDSETGTGI